METWLLLPCLPNISAYSDLEIVRETLTKKEIANVRSTPGVLEVLEPMPVQLIEPIRNDQAQGEAADGAATWGLEAIGAMNTPYTGSGVKVAVLDTGIDANHVAFRGVQLIQRNFTDEDSSDINGHGTHVAGTIFGGTVDGKRIGVSPGIETGIIGKVLGAQGGSTAEVLRAIKWAADQGATVISMSLGIDYPGYVRQLTESGYPQELAVSIALSAYQSNISAYDKLANYLCAQGTFMPPVVFGGSVR